jgi:predicted CoA-binding protein
MGKTTLVLGASPNPDRFSYKAIQRLQRINIEVIAIGRKDVDLGNIKIKKGMPEDIGVIHTISMYISPQNQKEYYNYILSLHPERIIFNPGTMNPELADMAKREGIEILDDCMLSMLNSGLF